MLVEVGEDGAIVLRQAGVYPVEIYTDERIREFERADRMAARDRAALKAKLRKQ